MKYQREISKPNSHEALAILLVEDDPAIAAALETMLALASYDCRVFHDGSEAMETLLLGSKFDLAVIDLMLPGRSGFELTEVCKQRQIPVIIITARTDLSSEVRGFELGAEDYLIKPFQPSVTTLSKPLLPLPRTHIVKFILK